MSMLLTVVPSLDAWLPDGPVHRLIFAVDIVNFQFINNWWPWVYDWLSGTR